MKAVWGEGYRKVANLGIIQSEHNWTHWLLLWFVHIIRSAAKQKSSPYRCVPFRSAGWCVWLAAAVPRGIYMCVSAWIFKLQLLLYLQLWPLPPPRHLHTPPRTTSSLPVRRCSPEQFCISPSTQETCLGVWLSFFISCLVGEDFWYMGQRCDVRMTRGRLIGACLAILLIMVTVIGVLAFVAVRRYKAALIQAKVDQTRSRYAETLKQIQKWYLNQCEYKNHFVFLDLHCHISTAAQNGKTKWHALYGEINKL